MMPARRRCVLLLLALLPLATPIVSPTTDGPFIYSYCAAMLLLSAWFCWKASLRYPLEMIRWRTVVLSQCVHSVAYALAAQRVFAWVNPTTEAWLGNACISISWVLFLPALMGARSVRGKWVRMLDYLLAMLTSGLMTWAIGSGADPGNGTMRILVVQVVITLVFLAALMAWTISTRSGVRSFSSVLSIYLGVTVFVCFLLNVVNLFWVQEPNILFSDMLISIPELLLCDLAVRQYRLPPVAGPEFEPVLVDSLQPALLTIGGVLLSLFGYHGHAMAAGTIAAVLVCCYALRTQLFYHQMFLREKQLRLRASEMQEHATRDALTGVGNRRWLDEEGAKLLAAARSYPCCLMLVDTDNFKEVNDTFGHPAGDDVLRAVASVLSAVNAQVKRGCCARIGGDEFATIWPGTSHETAMMLAESVRAALAEKRIDGVVSATVSIGIASTTESTQLMEMVRQADQALYRAKAAGRNRVRGPENAE